MRRLLWPILCGMALWAGLDACAVKQGGRMEPLRPGALRAP